MLLDENSSYILTWVIFIYVNSSQQTIVYSKYRNNGKKYLMFRKAFPVNALLPFLIGVCTSYYGILEICAFDLYQRPFGKSLEKSWQKLTKN